MQEAAVSQEICKLCVRKQCKCRIRGNGKAAGRPPQATAKYSLVPLTGRQCQELGVSGIWRGSLPTTWSVFPLSYYRSKAKNYTCFTVSLFQGILWIWNFICLVSIHHVLSVKFQLLSVSRLGICAKIVYPNVVIIALHAVAGPTTGSWKNERLGGSFNHQDRFGKC